MAVCWMVVLVFRSMSWLPFYNSWMVFVGLVSLILWKLLGVGAFIVVGVFGAYSLISEVLMCEARYKLAFWLFIFSEVAAFAGLLMTVCWSGTLEALAMSDWLELPFLGCFLLIGSSLTIAGYHSNMGSLEGDLALALTILLGAGFVGMQIWEFYDCECDWLNHFYYAASFSTVGLHFTHVLIGLGALSVVLALGPSVMGKYYCTLVIWYWHFVDYIWLLVFGIVYVS